MMRPRRDAWIGSFRRGSIVALVFNPVSITESGFVIHYFRYPVFVRKVWIVVPVRFRWFFAALECLAGRYEVGNMSGQFTAE